MLRARRRGFFTRSYELAENGNPITELTGFKRESCSFIVAGREYRVRREGRKRFTFSLPDGHVATAERVGNREWAIASQAGRLNLVRPSMWRSAWELRRGSSVAGIIRHDGGFGRSSTADLHADIPLPLRVFAFYVVLMIWERTQAAAAAGGAAGGAAAAGG